MHFHQMVIVRAPGLLPMLYTPRELGEEVGVSPRTIRDWMQMGMPHERDAKGRIWINGVEFAEWVESERTERRGHRLKKDEAYCLRCRRPVQLIEPGESRTGKLILLRATCPACGTAINRGAGGGKSR